MSDQTPQAWGRITASVLMKGWQCIRLKPLRTVGLWHEVGHSEASDQITEALQCRDFAKSMTFC